MLVKPIKNMKMSRINLQKVVVGLGLLLASFGTSALAGTPGVPNPAACVDDGKLWSNYQNPTQIYTHLVGSASNNVNLGSTGISNYLGDLAWGADGFLYGEEFTAMNSVVSFSPLWTIGVKFAADGTPSLSSNTSKSISLTFADPILSGGVYRFNSLGGLPNGNLLAGLTSAPDADANTSRIYSFNPNNPTATKWIDVKAPDGSYVMASGDMMYYKGDVYAFMNTVNPGSSPTLKDSYIYTIPVDINYNPTGGYSVAKLSASGSSPGQVYGATVYHGTIYSINAANSNIYSVNPITGVMQDTQEDFSVIGPYGLTSRPEPWGGYCPTITMVKKTVDATGALLSSSSSASFGFSGDNSFNASQALTLKTSAANPQAAATASTIDSLSTATNITETPSAGWKYTSVDCRNISGAQVSTSALSTGTGFTVPANTIIDSDALTCTVTNTTVPLLSIIKDKDTAFVKVTAKPENQTTTALSVSEYTPGQIVYTFEVSNTGLANANSVAINDILPTGLTFVNAKDQLGNTLTNTGSGQTVKLTLPGSLAVGASQKITITASLAPNANTNQPVYLNTASTSSTEITTAVTSNEVRTDTVYTKLFKQVQNLGVAPTGSAPKTPGNWSNSGTGLPKDVLEYCIDFVNYGTTALSNYKVSDKLPDNTTYLLNSAVVKSGSMTNPSATAFPGASVGLDGTGKYIVATGINLDAPGNAAGNPSSGTMCFRATIN